MGKHACFGAIPLEIPTGKGAGRVPLNHYIEKGGQRLRCGYTTGSCAALAAKAAARMLLTGTDCPAARLTTPRGIEVTVDIEETTRTTDCVRCGMRKDGGDDWDATHDLLIYAAVTKTRLSGVTIAGGEGVGRVTRPGLEQPVGEAAINSVPRRMITRELEQVCADCDYQGGLAVEISAPGGETVAAKTFNPQLGIVGGISILGTTGIVEPQSLQALVDTIAVELNVQAAAGQTRLIITPGNYGESFLAQHPPREELPQVKCSNFVGETLDLAAQRKFQQLYLVGHAGKFVKLAAGIMNTHSRWADGRAEVFAAHAALAGAGQETIAQLMTSTTSDQCIAILDEVGLRRPVLESILAKVLAHTARRAGPDITVEAVLFTNRYGPLVWSPGAGELLGLKRDP